MTARMVATGSSAHPYEVTLTACRSFAELADDDLNQMWIQYTCRKTADSSGTEAPYGYDRSLDT